MNIIRTVGQPAPAHLFFCAHAPRSIEWQLVLPFDTLPVALGFAALSPARKESMMFRMALNLLAILVALAAHSSARAEIPPESRDKADLVMTGVVRGVYVRDEGHYRNYVVELLLDEVEKGKSVERRDTIYVYCFKRKSSAPQEPSAGGHRAIPKEGQRIKAFVKDDRGKHNAIYPNWFDEAKPAGKE